MNLSDELRATLREHAEAAPGGNTLMTNVRYRQMRSRRQRFMIGGLALTAIVAVAIAIPLLNREPAAQTAAAPQASPASLVPAGDYLKDLPLFPYQPGWVPPQLNDLAPGLDGTYLKLTSAGHDFDLSVGPTHAFYVPLDNALETGATISGRPATLRTGHQHGQATVQLFWQDGDRLLSMSTSLLTTAEAIRFAENLRPGALEIKPGIRMGLLPPRHILVAADPEVLCFAPAELYYRQPSPTLCLRLGQYQLDPAAPTTTLQVRGKSATLSMVSGFNLVVPVRPPTVNLVIHADRTSVASETVLRQLTENVTFTDPSLE